MPDDIYTKPYVCNFSEKGPIDMECAVTDDNQSVEVQSQLWEFSNNWQTSYSFPKNGQKTRLNWTLKHY